MNDEKTKNSSLTQLANHYGCDKGTVGPSEYWLVNNYTDVYEAYLRHLRFNDFSLCEVGLGIQKSPTDFDVRFYSGANTDGGASVKMWYDYFPKAKIYGVDITDASFLENDRIKTFTIDQGNNQQWSNFLSNNSDLMFDVIIDDGSHIAKHQQVTFSFLFQRLRPGGLYFVEDLHNNGTETGAKSGVVSTRYLLKTFVKSGELVEPNALFNKIDFKNSIAEIYFHCPQIHVSKRKLIHQLIGGKSKQLRVYDFVPESERLAVIVKKSA